MAGLTPEQQQLAKDAAKWVPRYVKLFIDSMPCLRSAASMCDLESAAYLACCNAARTYKPSKGGPSAYFSVAIKNAMLREIQKEISTGSTSVYRISVEESQRRCPPNTKLREVAMTCLKGMDPEEREWIESYVLEGASIRSLGRRFGLDFRNTEKRLFAILEKLRRAVNDAP